MSKKKMTGREVLEEALRGCCSAYCDQYPRYEGEIDLGDDYENYMNNLIKRSKNPFQRYFNIVYLGQIVQCSIEFTENTNININQIDLASKEPNQKTIELEVKICSNLPVFNQYSETPSSLIISSFDTDLKNGGIYDMKTDNKLANYK